MRLFCPMRLFCRPSWCRTELRLRPIGDLSGVGTMIIPGDVTEHGFPEYRRGIARKLIFLARYT